MTGISMTGIGLFAARPSLLALKTWKPDFPMLAGLVRFGIPVALLYIVIAAGGIALQAAINRQGSLFVAGFTATNELYGLLECAAISLGLALATFTAQNFGAGDKARVKAGVRTGLLFYTEPAAWFIALVSVAAPYYVLRKKTAESLNRTTIPLSGLHVYLRSSYGSFHFSL